MTPEKQSLISALRAFIRQRPGLEFGNYGDLRAYRQESREITRDLRHAEILIDAVAARDAITADRIIEGAKHAYSGRLEITYGPRIDYCVGQYFPTEYRRAVCAVMASLLWDYWRGCMPAPVTTISKTYKGIDRPVMVDLYPFGKKKLCAGDYLRAKAAQEFRRPIANRWFQ